MAETKVQCAFVKGGTRSEVLKGGTMRYIFDCKSRNKHRCALANAGKTALRSILAGFPIEKWKMMIKKSSLHHWESIPNFLSRICQSLYDVKENPLELCSPLDNRILKANYDTVRGAAESWKGSHSIGTDRFLRNSLISTYWMNHSQIHLAGQHL
jgi:hypothetical protein